MAATEINRINTVCSSRPLLTRRLTPSRAAASVCKKVGHGEAWRARPRTDQVTAVFSSLTKPTKAAG